MHKINSVNVKSEIKVYCAEFNSALLEINTKPVHILLVNVLRADLKQNKKDALRKWTYYEMNSFGKVMHVLMSIELRKTDK